MDCRITMGYMISIRVFLSKSGGTHFFGDSPALHTTLPSRLHGAPQVSNLEVSQSRGTFFGGPHSRDYEILGSIFQFPHFWKLLFSPDPKP